MTDPRLGRVNMGVRPGNGSENGRGRWRMSRPYTALLAAGVLAGGAAAGASAASASTSATARPASAARPAAASVAGYREWVPTRTPIKHLVVIFQENVSFDHYFGTYPHAANTDGSPFHAKPGTPSVNGLTPSLLTANPNTYNPHPAHPLPGAHLRPGPRLPAGAGGVRRRQDGQVRPVHEHAHLHRHADHPVRRARPGHGLLRRQHRHRAVELRPELRDERQQLQHELRAVHPRRAQRHRRQRQPRLRGQPEPPACRWPTPAR